MPDVAEKSTQAPAGALALAELHKRVKDLEEQRHSLITSLVEIDESIRLTPVRCAVCIEALTLIRRVLATLQSQMIYSKTTVELH